MKERSLLYGSSGSWRHLNFLQHYQVPEQRRKSKLLGMQELAFTKKFLGKYIIFNKNLLSWTLLLARMWDAEFSLSMKQNRRSHKALFARCRLEVAIRHNLTQSTGRSQQDMT